MSDSILPLPDVSSLCDADLKALIARYSAMEDELAMRLAFVQTYQNILRAELTARASSTYSGELPVLDNLSIEQLTRILTTSGH